MKYIIRSIKYLIYFAIIFFLIVIILCLFMHRDITDFAALFKEGALWQILVMFVAVAAIYPALGYKKNKIVMDGSFKDYRKSIMEVMTNAEYQLADET
ncbi:MAG: hypothetical protein HUJ90_04940, partial [Bacteroidales bacterium]|nr:hypothetical protein [Bacteroidales bacterium]